MGVGILGLGHYLPERVVTNKEFEKMVDTTDEWIRTRSGIEERRFARDDEETSDMAYEAAKLALEDANVSPEEIDMIIVATVTQDMPFPSVAAMLQERLGAKRAAAMDLAAACAGFLWWNWHPARIFMGDVGSGFLGIVFATLAVASENRSAVPLLLWVVLLGVFIFDATVTLVRRVLRRERWYEAHRSHAYQRAVQAGRSHHVVTAGALGVGLLLGIGVWVAHLWRDSIPIVVLACLSLLTWIYFRIEKARPMEPEPSGSP
ncbi:MAG: hypothetical protein LOD92_09315, partial [Bacillales bacterium]